MRKTKSPARPNSRTKRRAISNAKRHAVHNRRNLVLFCAGLVVLAVLIQFGRAKQNELVIPKLPPPPADALYKQAGQPIEIRVEDLLSRMTLEEKIGQMALVDKKSLGKIEDIKTYSLGGILSGAGAKPPKNTPQGWLEMVNSMKQQASQSRLGIPILYGIDANHGHANVLGATVFPHAIGLGASGDEKLVEEIARASAEEIRATGINWSYSPSLDAPRDIRWGRVYEAFSDNPILNSRLGAAHIRGTQKNTDSTNTYVLASAKHYLATGSMVWGESNHKKFKIDQGNVLENEQALETEYLPPYKAAVENDVASIMIALSEWDDMRIIDNKYLLTDKLKGQLGFEGFIVSDWYGVYEYAGTSDYKANIKTINAGLDMAMLPYDYKSFIKDVRRGVQKSKISQTRIDDAVRRILRQKFKAGLFDTPEASPNISSVGSNAHRELARKSVAASAVLLKNKDSLLPLSKNSGQIIIAGSGADNVGRQSGAWTVEWQGVDGNWMPGGTSILQGMREVVGNNGAKINYNKEGHFSLGKKADVGIVIISEKPYAEGWGDNPAPQIDKADLEAISRVKQSSQKIVVVMVSGRPLLISDLINNWDSAVAIWLPGSEGAGLADLLFGQKQFSAKLPLPWPASADQLPIKSDGSTQNGSRTLFPRGHGLSAH